mgnify:CR=1 FL=1
MLVVPELRQKAKIRYAHVYHTYTIGLRLVMNKNSKLVHLSLSIENVAHWGFWEALRELLQNALDMKKHNFYVTDDAINISTFDHPMDESTLLIGNSSKRDDDNTIGKYGEGYKLACLVLLREGYTVKIRNGLDSWTFLQEVHPQLDCACIAVNIEYGVFRNIDEHSANTVTFSVQGVTQEDIRTLEGKYLGRSTIYDYYDVVVAHDGTLVFKGEETPSVYVNGLFVCHLPDHYWFSYYLPPGLVPLDRDRNAVDTWELNWTIASVLEKAQEYDLIAKMSEEKAPDLHEYYSPSTAKYYTTCVEGTSASEKLSSISLSNFKLRYGDNAFPISEETKPDKARLLSRTAVAQGLVPVPVPKGLYKLLPDEVKKIDLGTVPALGTPAALMEKFLLDNKKHMRSKSVKNFNRLIDTIILMT